jgi:hypothetical protein
MYISIRKIPKCSCSLAEVFLDHLFSFPLPCDLLFVGPVI